MRLLISGMILVGLLMSAGGVHAANLLTNPGFDTNLNGWSSTWNGTWDSVDEFGDPHSGSVIITTQFNGAGTGNVLLWQCVSVTPGETILVAASTYLASGQGATGYGWVWGGFNDGPNCSGSTIWSVSKQGNSSLLDTWERLEVQGVAPTGTQSLRLNLYCRNNSTSVDFQCRADNVYVPEPSRWLLALIALGTLAALHLSLNYSRAVLKTAG